MNNDRLEHFKKILLEEKQNILNTLGRMENHHPKEDSIKEYTQELSSYDNHPADLGTEVFMMTMETSLENHHKHKVLEIDKALEKIETGTYGSCETCNNLVTDERLEIKPEASICIKCANEKIEPDKINTDKPSEELIIPEYRDGDKDDYNGFDGEDAYQAVARFNQVKDDPSFGTGDDLGIFDDYEIGAVEPIESISESYYKSQLPYTGKGIMDSDDEIKNKYE